MATERDELYPGFERTADQDGPLDEASFRDLLRRLASDGRDLIRGEIELAERELRATAGRVVGAAVRLGIAAACLAVGALSLTAFGIILLGGTLLGGNYWLASLLTGLLLLAVGALLAQSGTKRLKPEKLRPGTTLTQIRSDAQWAKQEVRELKRGLLP